jgi:hypothetical protein
MEESWIPPIINRKCSSLERAEACEGLAKPSFKSGFCTISPWAASFCHTPVFSGVYIAGKRRSALRRGNDFNNGQLNQYAQQHLI